ncbi:hypothetical protein AJ80_00941 [Polytolypa hystricis UAMH7299]|uniref:Uncharacterized protein n=1 Tax=Polytolypa hystricis (strain UAMH7299) TaxID=1447883 RepID=A0A2B7Z331_POLH7|nr:hypothetical protein AJ80_00941 [Polytolypa hystricis UAMH7299]
MDDEALYGGYLSAGGGLANRSAAIMMTTSRDLAQWELLVGCNVNSSLLTRMLRCLRWTITLQR